MLKPKITIPKNTILWGLVALLVMAGIITLTISFRGAGATADDVSVVYTNAAATLEAQQLTLQAAEPTAMPAFTLTPTITVTPFATSTGFVQTGLASPTTSLSSGSAVGCDNSVFVTDVTIPDGTQMTPGQVFTKTWRLQNNGTCPWTTAYKLSFVSGDAMGGNAVNLTRTVNPGESVDIAVPMTAPAAPGQARGDWRLVNASAQQFGTFVYVIINVGTTTGTSTTAAPTATTGAPSATPVTPSPTEDIPPTEENGG